MSTETVCAAANAAIRAAAPEDRVSLIWDSPGMSISFNWDRGGWFWVAYDRGKERLAGHGWAKTIEAAAGEAWRTTRAPMLSAAE